jgi:hypothetical protein
MIALISEQQFLLTTEAFEEMILEAARTIIKLPHAGPRAPGSGWPDFIRDAAESYGYGTVETKPSPPTAREIDRLDRVIDVLWQAHPQDSRLVMVCAFSAQRKGKPKLRGIAWSKVARFLDWHRDTVKARYFASLERLRVLAGTLHQKNL